MTRNVQINNRIRKNESDIALYGAFVAKLAGKPEAQAYVHSFERIIAEAKKSNAILQAAR